MLALLPSRAVLAVSGEDAKSFLNGLLTVDTLKLAPHAPRYGLLLSPQGKFLHDLFVREEGGRILLDAEAARLEDLRKRLMMYRLRAKVEIAEEKGLRVYAGWNEPAPGDATLDPRLPALGFRLYAPDAATTAMAEDYDLHRLALGVPDGSRDLTVDRSLALEWGLDALKGVDFDKGCYVGQEVTARTHFRAQLRKYIFRVRGKTLPPAGTPVMQEAREAGALASSRDGIGLALLRIEEATNGLPLSSAGIDITAELPAWATLPAAA